MTLLIAQVVCWIILITRPVELSIIVSEVSYPRWKELADDFESTHSGTIIRLVTDSDDTAVRKKLYEEDFKFDIARYDLVFMDVVWTESFKDHLVNLNSFIERDRIDISDFFDSEISIGTYDDGSRGQDALYRLPMYPDVGVLYYRKDLLEAAGLPLPETLGELQQTVKTIKETAGIPYGYVWQGDNYEGLVVNFFEIMRSQGGQWIDDGQVTLNSEATLEAANILKQLIETGVSPDTVTDYTETLSKQAFIDGKAIFLRGWPDFWADIEAEPSLKGEVAIARPFSFVKNKAGISCRGGWGFGIAKNSVHKKKAWELIKYFTSEDVQRDFVLASGSLPSRKALYDDPDIQKKYPFMSDLRTYLEESSEFRPSLESYTEVSKILQGALSDMLRQEGVVKDAMQRAQRETEEKLSND